jgi:tRNA-intron endonuclease, archaea type
MDATGELTGNTIIIHKPRDIGRLYDKSRFGHRTKNGDLALNLLEAVYLTDEQKLQVYHQRKTISFTDLVTKAALTIPDFESIYLAYKDLRKRGYAINWTATDTPITFTQTSPTPLLSVPLSICAFSERDLLDIAQTLALSTTTNQHQGKLWYALVDEEGDITYYDITLPDLHGEIPLQSYPKTTGMLLKDRLLIFDEPAARQLLEKEFYGKPFGPGLQLSLVEALYLVTQGILQITTPDHEKLTEKQSEQTINALQPDILQRLQVYTDLKSRGLLVKTGFKFGADFRAYTTVPDKAHAEYLIHVVNSDFTSIWAEISRAVRLAHTVNKEFIFAVVSKKLVEYIRLGRLRP